MNSNDLIVEIFNNMNFKQKPLMENDSRDKKATFNESVPAHIYESLKNDRKPSSIIDATNNAEKALEKWKSVSAKERADSLHKVWKALLNKSESLPTLKNELSVLIDYFDFYTDMAEEIDESLTEPVGVVLIVLPPQLCFYIIAATVPAALAAGCTVIINTDKQAVVPLFLEEVVNEAGLPDGVVNVVTESINYFYDALFNQILYFGSGSRDEVLRFREQNKRIKYFHPRNTAAFILESCDLNAAIAEIFCEPWDCPSLWRVSTIVVQESIFGNFLDMLKSKMELFISMSGDLKSKEIVKRIKNVISTAVKTGPLVEKDSINGNEWGPTELLNYQNQEGDLANLNVMVCRSAKEGVKLLNNCEYAFCASIWSEFSAQALEIASQLRCSNIWINCHGVFNAKVPLVATGLNGNCVFGGTQGILEYLSHVKILPCGGGNLTAVSTLGKSENLEILISAQNAFDSWRNVKCKRIYFKALTEFLETQQESSFHVQLLENLKRVAKCSRFSEKNDTDEFFIVHKQEPIGVICLFLYRDIDLASLVFLVALPIQLGNAIIVLTENPLVTEMANLFNEFFPKNLLTVIPKPADRFHIVEDPIVQAMWGGYPWISEKIDFSKRFWYDLPKAPPSFQDLIIKECMRSKVIWLPKVEKFP